MKAEFEELVRAIAKTSPEVDNERATTHTSAVSTEEWVKLAKARNKKQKKDEPRSK